MAFVTARFPDEADINGSYQEKFNKKARVVSDAIKKLLAIAGRHDTDWKDVYTIAFEITCVIGYLKDGTSFTSTLFDLFFIEDLVCLGKLIQKIKNQDKNRPLLRIVSQFEASLHQDQLSAFVFLRASLRRLESELLNVLSSFCLESTQNKTNLKGKVYKNWKVSTLVFNFFNTGDNDNSIPVTIFNVRGIAVRIFASQQLLILEGNSPEDTRARSMFLASLQKVITNRIDHSGKLAI